MKTKGMLSKLPFVKQYRFKWMLIIAISWTLIEIIRFSVFVLIEGGTEYTFIPVTLGLVLFQFVAIFTFSMLMASMVVVRFKKMFRGLPLWMGLVFKTSILYAIQLLLYSLLFFVVYHFLYRHSLQLSFNEYRAYFFHSHYLLNNTASWIFLFIVTLLVMEITEKYSPRLFRDILSGKYIEPREENKIIMFIDLKDSTPIAEQLGHKKYFLFMRDFVYHTSKAILKCGADIYQYVGDEVVLSWPANEKNCGNAIQALLEVRKELQQNSNYYRNKYAVLPDYRAGIHTGPVTIGEIGIVKKDLAMSGDSMNITARIKNRVTDLNKKFIATKAFGEVSSLKAFQVESAGVIDLKGKENGMELFILKL